LVRVEVVVHFEGVRKGGRGKKKSTAPLWGSFLINRIGWTTRKRIEYNLGLSSGGVDPSGRPWRRMSKVSELEQRPIVRINKKGDTESGVINPAGA